MTTYLSFTLESWLRSHILNCFRNPSQTNVTLTSHLNQGITLKILGIRWELNGKIIGVMVHSLLLASLLTTWWFMKMGSHLTPEIKHWYKPAVCALAHTPLFTVNSRLILLRKERWQSKHKSYKRKMWGSYERTSPYTISSYQENVPNAMLTLHWEHLEAWIKVCKAPWSPRMKGTLVLCMLTMTDGNIHSTSHLLICHDR